MTASTITSTYSMASSMGGTASWPSIPFAFNVYTIGDKVSASVGMQFTDTATWASQPLPTWIQVLLDVLSVSDSPTATWKSLQVLMDDASFVDAVNATLQALVASNMQFASTPSGTLKLALALLDRMQVGSVPTVNVNAFAAITLAFAIQGVIADAQRGMLVATADFAGALTDYLVALVARLDAWQITAIQSSSAILHVLVADTTAFADGASDYLKIVQALLDGAQFGITLFTGQDTYVAWVMTAATRAMRRYVNYPFNSFGTLNGRLCGANANGIYWLDGDTDAGASIPALVRTGLLDFGSRQLKQMDRAYLGYTSDGTLGLKVITTSETGDKVEYTYLMTATAANAPREQRVKIGRGMRSVYWQFELVNDATGSSFELHDVTVLPITLARRVF